jgi:hypothetical protein
MLSPLEGIEFEDECKISFATSPANSMVCTVYIYTECVYTIKPISCKFYVLDTVLCSPHYVHTYERDFVKVISPFFDLICV